MNGPASSIPEHPESNEALLADCIERSLSVDSHDFQWDMFFQFWFRQQGYPCFFLFKRHLGVTNAQYVELFSLLRLHARESTGTSCPRPLYFHSTEQVKGTVVDAINSLLEVSALDRKAQAARFAATYIDVFASTVAVDMFYCSCAAFLPPGLRVDLMQICADAGYIHSAGKSVFVRNIKKARQKDFHQSISHHLSLLKRDDLPIPFVVYAHEDFSGYDKDSREQIHRGIESTKIYLEKMNMGSYRLSQIVDNMRESYAGRLTIPRPGPYSSEHTFSGPRRGLWLISDRSVSPSSPTNAGSDRYYICYEQLVKSASPFFIFDENKPAWKSHTTLPHSLTAALLNSTRPLPTDAAICDPFGGTGTTWLEVKRLALSASVRCSDLSPATRMMVDDNLNFFLMSADDLRQLAGSLRRTLDAAKRLDENANGPELQCTLDLVAIPGLLKADAYSYAATLLDDLRSGQPHEDQEFVLSAAFVNQLSSLEPLARIIFYVALRAELRFQGGFKRKSLTFNKAFCDSLVELIGQIEQFAQLRQDAEADPYATSPAFRKFRSTYSTAVVPGMHWRPLADFRPSFLDEVFVSDARDLPADSLDVIICDPPYGFNTTEDQSALADLYAGFVSSALQALHEHGHLIICLPAESYTGRDLPYCTRADVVTSQVLAKADALGKTVYIPATSVPARLFVPPYYWESERALRRVILHFRVARAG